MLVQHVAGEELAGRVLGASHRHVVDGLVACLKAAKFPGARHLGGPKETAHTSADEPTGVPYG